MTVAIKNANKLMDDKYFFVSLSIQQIRNSDNAKKALARKQNMYGYRSELSDFWVANP